MKIILVILVSMMLQCEMPTSRKVFDCQPKPSMDSVQCEYVMKQVHDQVPPKTYKMIGTVVEVDHFEDVVVIQDASGERWAFFGAEDWLIGDYAELTMEDAGIANYFWDDEITDARYIGYNENYE